MADDFYSFEKTLRELGLTEEQLKKAVSEGEIRAFRDESSMKFKKEDIDRHKKALANGRSTFIEEQPTGEFYEELFGDIEETPDPDLLFPHPGRSSDGPLTSTQIAALDPITDLAVAQNEPSQSREAPKTGKSSGSKFLMILTFLIGLVIGAILASQLL